MKTYDDCIIFLLAKAYQKAHGDFKKRLQSYGLTPIQHLILEVLWGEDGLSATDIGKKLVLDMPKKLSVLYGESVAKKLNQLAGAMGLEAEIRLG
jgi:hypothetical protein